MKKNFSVLFNFTVFSLVLFTLISCSKKENHEFDNYVHEAIIANVKGFDPVASGSDYYSAIVMDQIYESLLQYNYLERPTHVEPLLADGMPKISKDGKTYTFKIKKGVFFHDDPAFKATNGKGRELEAEDFIYSWKRSADPKNNSDTFWMFEGKVKGMSEWRQAASKAGVTDYSKPITGVTAPDKYTLQVVLNEPFPLFLYYMTMTGASAIAHEVAETYGPELQNHPVGTGPYKFRSWVHNAEIIMDKNPNYREEFYPSKGEESDKAAGLLVDAGKRLPLNDGVIFTEVVESQPRWLNFRKGVFDWIDIPKDNFGNVVKNGELSDELKNQGIVLTKWVDPDLTFTGFNMEDSIVGKNKYLRQAMSVATNISEVIEKFYNGRAAPAQGPIPPTVVGYDPNRKDPYQHYDLAKAKELLKKAGYPNGEGLPEIVYEINNGDTRQMAEYFQNEMAKIGIKIRVNVNTWPQFVEKLKTRKAQMFALAWAADYPDAENYLQLFYSKNGSPGPNNSNYNNPEYDKLYEQISKMLDGPAKNKIYQRMADIVIEDAPYIFDANRKPHILTHGWFKNYKRNLTLLNYTKYYRIDTAEKAELKKKL